MAMQEMKAFMSGIRPTPDPSLLWRGIECRTTEAIYSPPSQGGAGGESVLLYLICFDGETRTPTDWVTSTSD